MALERNWRVCIVLMRRDVEMEEGREEGIK